MWGYFLCLADFNGLSPVALLVAAAPAGWGLSEPYPAPTPVRTLTAQRQGGGGRREYFFLRFFFFVFFFRERGSLAVLVFVAVLPRPVFWAGVGAKDRKKLRAWGAGGRSTAAAARGGATRGPWR